MAHDLKIEEYKKSVLVKGQSTYNYRDALREMGGKWNSSLKAWVFGGKRKQMLEKWLSTLQNNKQKSVEKKKEKTVSKRKEKSVEKKKEKTVPKKKEKTVSKRKEKTVSKGKEKTVPKKKNKSVSKTLSKKQKKISSPKNIIPPSIYKIDMSQNCAVPPKAGESSGYQITFENACNFYLKYPINDEQIRANWSMVLERARKVIPDDLKRVKNAKKLSINARDLAVIFEIFDNVYFQGSLWKLVCEAGGSLNFYFSDMRTDCKAGVCSKINDTDFDIIIFSKLFQNIFTNASQKSFLSGGRKCFSRLECLLNTFAHELCHFIIRFFCEDKVKETSHGPTFKKFVRHLFGQTEVGHGLFPNVANYEPRLV